MYRVLTTIFLLVSCILVSCQNAPRPGYAEQPHIIRMREQLCRKLLNLLPEPQQVKAASEAKWLADTAYKSAVAIARYNDPVFVNWLNNRAVNTQKNYRHRGLCWHYQHDLYRELRRRPLKYFRLGCCVEDKGKGGEHHAVYIAARQGQWPDVVIVDAWWFAGRLKVEEVTESWEDEPSATKILTAFYREGHKLPLEHWAMVRRGNRYDDYIYSNLPEARRTEQWKYMQQQMKQGMKRRKGKPVDY